MVDDEVIHDRIVAAKVVGTMVVFDQAMDERSRATIDDMATGAVI
jgi:hypothetical protein